MVTELCILLTGFQFPHNRKRDSKQDSAFLGIDVDDNSDSNNSNSNNNNKILIIATIF